MGLGLRRTEHLALPINGHVTWDKLLIFSWSPSLQNEMGLEQIFSKVIPRPAPNPSSPETPTSSPRCYVNTNPDNL
jgi:hypothetical protein